MQMGIIFIKPINRSNIINIKEIQARLKQWINRLPLQNSLLFDEPRGLLSLERHILNPRFTWFQPHYFHLILNVLEVLLQGFIGWNRLFVRRNVTENVLVYVCHWEEITLHDFILVFTCEGIVNWELRADHLALEIGWEEDRDLVRKTEAVVHLDVALQR